MRSVLHFGPDAPHGVPVRFEDQLVDRATGDRLAFRPLRSTSDRVYWDEGRGCWVRERRTLEYMYDEDEAVDE